MEKPEPRYKAADVCRLAGVQPYVLRYWESEFPALAADRGVPGPRTYSARDLRVIERIKKLLHDEGYTIAGAKKKLDGELKGGLLEFVALVPPPLPAAALAAPEAEPEAAPAPPPVPAPDMAATDPALQPLPPERPRRKRAPAEPPPPPAPREEESAPLFEGERIEVPKEAATAPVAQTAGPDPRVALAVSELREILTLLSRDEP